MISAKLPGVQYVALNTDMRFPNKLLGIIGKLQDAWCGDGGNPLDTFGFGLCGGGKEGRLRPFNKAGSMQFDMTAPVDPTFNLGVLWEPKDWFGAGLVYQSGTRSTLTGRYTFQAEPMLPRFVNGMYSSLLGPVVAAMKWVGFFPDGVGGIYPSATAVVLCYGLCAFERDRTTGSWFVLVARAGTPAAIVNRLNAALMTT